MSFSRLFLIPDDFLTAVCLFLGTGRAAAGGGAAEQVKTHIIDKENVIKHRFA